MKYGAQMIITLSFIRLFVYRPTVYFMNAPKFIMKPDKTN